jgi:glycosyltransferase involved in cell wall biosynthesis
VIVPSTATAQMMRELAVPDDRISLTPFVVDNDWWIEQARRADRHATRAEWQVSERDLVVLFCAKFQDWKRPLDLLRAFAKAAVADAVLVFAGEGPLRSQIESEAAALGVASRVRILGFTNQSRLPAVYRASDLLVLPSSYEPFGVVVNEAMCCGCVPLASEGCGAARDLVAPVSPELVFRCGDTEALAAALKRLLSDRSALAAMAANARARMEAWSPRENVAATVAAVARSVHRRKGEASPSMADSNAKFVPRNGVKS